MNGRNALGRSVHRNGRWSAVPGPWTGPVTNGPLPSKTDLALRGNPFTQTFDLAPKKKEWYDCSNGDLHNCGLHVFDK